MRPAGQTTPAPPATTTPAAPNCNSLYAAFLIANPSNGPLDLNVLSQFATSNTACLPWAQNEAAELLNAYNAQVATLANLSPTPWYSTGLAAIIVTATIGALTAAIVDAASHVAKPLVTKTLAKTGLTDKPGKWSDLPWF